jgi:hypothetical protein
MGTFMCDDSALRRPQFGMSIELFVSPGCLMPQGRHVFTVGAAGSQPRPWQSAVGFARRGITGKMRRDRASRGRGSAAAFGGDSIDAF